MIPIARMKDPINLSIGLPDFDVPEPVKAAATQYCQNARAAPKQKQDRAMRTTPRVMLRRSPSRAHTRFTVSRAMRMNRLRTVVMREPWALVKCRRAMISGWYTANTLTPRPTVDSRVSAPPRQTSQA